MLLWFSWPQDIRRSITEKGRVGGGSGLVNPNFMEHMSLALALNSAVEVCVYTTIPLQGKQIHMHRKKNARWE